MTTLILPEACINKPKEFHSDKWLEQSKFCSCVGKNVHMRNIIGIRILVGKKYIGGKLRQEEKSLKNVGEILFEQNI